MSNEKSTTPEQQQPKPAASSEAEHSSPVKENVDNGDDSFSLHLNGGPKNPNHCTPALIKVRQTMKQFQVQSPSDNVMSPCTRKINMRHQQPGTQTTKPTAFQKLNFD